MAFRSTSPRTRFAIAASASISPRSMTRWNSSAKRRALHGQAQARRRQLIIGFLFVKSLVPRNFLDTRLKPAKVSFKRLFAAVLRLESCGLERVEKLS